MLFYMDFQPLLPLSARLTPRSATPPDLFPLLSFKRLRYYRKEIGVSSANMIHRPVNPIPSPRSSSPSHRLFVRKDSSHADLWAN